MLSSDYVPISMLHAAFKLHDQHGLTLHDAIATVSRNPAVIAAYLGAEHADG